MWAESHLQGGFFFFLIKGLFIIVKFEEIQFTDEK